ncbi:major facilitator superfamily domain-containing protein [Aspergillus ambiguus]|uniref:MCT family MFS transporter n=1 Tax=Aspergillus ambiguus TaxID=176160 RepID=UPI003CCD306A
MTSEQPERRPSLDDEEGLPAPSEKSPGDLHLAPDGGIQAWLVATGGACIFFSTLGVANTFGVFEEYYLTHQLRGEPADKVAWIGSLATFLQFAIGSIGGPLFDRYGAWLIRPTAVLYVFAMMMTSLCNKYWQFMLAQGILMGTSMGLLQFPAMAAVTQYFDKKRAAALGIVVSGSSIGGVVLPIALSKMLNGTSLGFGWSVRVIGFILVPLLSFSCITVRSRLPPRKTTFFIGAAFKDIRYNLIIGAFFFMLIAMFAPLFYIPTYAVSRGVEATLASYLLAIVNAASTFGRIIPGVLADKFGRLNIFMIGGLATGIVVFCFNEATSTAGLVVYSIVVGFFSGTIISGGAAAFTVCIKNPQEAGAYLGMGMALGSVAALIGPPVNGALINHYGGFSQMSIFSGVMCVVGGFIALAAKVATPQGIWGRV